MSVRTGTAPAHLVRRTPSAYSHPFITKQKELSDTCTSVSYSRIILLEDLT